MEQLPPPPRRPDSIESFNVPTPAPSPLRRPGQVTAAAVLLILSGVFALFGALAVFVSQNEPSIAGIEGAASVLGVVLLVSGALNVLAGVLVLRLSPAGRMMGMVFGALGVLGALGQLGSAAGAGLISLAINGFVIFALASNGHVFRPQGRG